VQSSTHTVQAALPQQQLCAADTIQVSYLGYGLGCRVWILGYRV